MRLLQSMFIALSTYSKLPVPSIDWKEENMRWSLCFFPLVGVIIGGLFCLVMALCDALNASDILRGALACAVPVLVSGGIHLDGLCDTADALASWQEKERRLEILKDPHAGAFAIIRCALYLTLLAGVYGSLRLDRCAVVVGLSFVLSRALSGMAAVTMNNARGSGLLFSFTDAAHLTRSRAALAVESVLCAAVMLFVEPLCALAALLGAAAVTLSYRAMARKYFGGATGDLAGYYLSVNELVMALGALLAALVKGALL